ncbi:hypothetical protein [Burkholderia sp. YIM B11467]
MNNLRAEIELNFDHFFQNLPSEVSAVTKALSNEKGRFLDSYFRLVTLQAWRTNLIDVISDSAANEFFKEAQNDALVSHSLARQGSWRVALICLRSCIENVLFGLYYLDHPVELVQWHSGGHLLGFTETIAYLAKHPSLSGVAESITGIDVIKSEYATLSKAVHGSAVHFRMTKGGVVQGLNIDSLPDLGAWLTRERQTLVGLNLLLVAFFHKHLGGAAHPNVRKVLGFTIPAAKHAEIKKQFGVLIRALKPKDD